MSESRWNAEDIVDGGPLGGGPGELVDRVREAIKSVGEDEYHRGYDAGESDGYGSGHSDGYDSGSRGELSKVLVYLDKCLCDGVSFGDAVANLKAKAHHR